MTDKQIKDGIDVGQCECYSVENNSCNKTLSGSCMKEKCQIFRLLQNIKSKEQECEELRQYHNKCCTELKNEKQALLEKYNQVSVNFHNGDYCNTEHCSLLKAKEQECEKVIVPMPDTNYAILTKEEFEQLDRLKKTNEELQKENEKLKEELEAVYDDCKGCPTCNEALYNANLYAKEYKKLKQTLTKIKEIAEIEIECKTYEIENDCFNETRCKALNEHIDFIKQILQKISECEVKEQC